MISAPKKKKKKNNRDGQTVWFVIIKHKNVDFK